MYSHRSSQFLVPIISNPYASLFEVGGPTVFTVRPVGVVVGALSADEVGRVVSGCVVAVPEYITRVQGPVRELVQQICPLL